MCRRLCRGSEINFTCLVIHSISRLFKYWGSNSWTLTVGKLEEYDTPTYMNNMGKGTCFTQVRYSYSVNDRKYSGAWLTPTLRNAVALEEWLAKELRVGKEVSLRYNPRKPGRSVLADGLSSKRNRSSWKPTSTCESTLADVVRCSMSDMAIYRRPSCVRTCLKKGPNRE